MWSWLKSSKQKELERKVARETRREKAERERDAVRDKQELRRARWEEMRVETREIKEEEPGCCSSFMNLFSTPQLPKLSVSRKIESEPGRTKYVRLP